MKEIILLAAFIILTIVIGGEFGEGTSLIDSFQQKAASQQTLGIPGLGDINHAMTTDTASLIGAK